MIVVSTEFLLCIVVENIIQQISSIPMRENGIRINPDERKRECIKSKKMIQYNDCWPLSMTKFVPVRYEFSNFTFLLTLTVQPADWPSAVRNLGEAEIDNNIGTVHRNRTILD